MVADPSTIPLSPEEYLRIERNSDVRSEYLNGQLLMMSRASRDHGKIVTNLVRELSTLLLDQPCEVHSHDMRVHIPYARAYFYPDVVFGCDDFERTDEIDDHLINPLVIIEVLSPSTEGLDRGKKFNAYQQVPTLREYILVSQDEPLISRYTRQDGNLWLLSTLRGIGATLEIAAIAASVPLSRIYLKLF